MLRGSFLHQHATSWTDTGGRSLSRTPLIVACTLVNRSMSTPDLASLSRFSAPTYVFQAQADAGAERPPSPLPKGAVNRRRRCSVSAEVDASKVRNTYIITTLSYVHIYIPRRLVGRLLGGVARAVGLLCGRPSRTTAPRFV